MTEKRGAGRPKKTLTDEQIIQVEALSARLTVDQVADYFGISRATFFRMMDRDPEILRRYKIGKAKAIAAVADKVLNLALDKNDKAAAFFYLKTQGGWRENFAVDLTSSDGTMSPKRLNEDDLKKELEARGLPKEIFEE